MINKKKIVIVTSGVMPIPAVKGGAIETLIDYLIEENENKNLYDLKIFCCDDVRSRLIAKTYKNTEIIYIKNRKPYSKINQLLNRLSLTLLKKPISNTYLNKVIKGIKETQPDLIVVENRIYYGYLIKSKINVRTILHLHNDFLNINTLFGKQASRCYDEIWTVSEYVRRRVEQTGYTDTKVLYNGIDLDIYNVDRKSNNINNSNLKNKKKIIYVGRLVPYKGVDILIDAFLRLKSRSEYCLVLVGDYDESYAQIKSFKKMIARKIENINDIFTTGKLNNDEVAKIYQSGDIGVIPSIVEESFCLSALEMLASGLPIICTNSGALPEVVGKDCAVIVNRENLCENLVRAIDGREFERINRENCKKQANKFPKEKFVKEFYENIERLLSRN